MLVRDIITRVNSLSDDQIPDLEIVGFINDAMDEIGREVNATFPSIPSIAYEYQSPVLPDKWVRNLIIPFAKGRVKEKDSSQFEWEVGYNTFITNLSDFSNSYKVPLQFVDLPPGIELETAQGPHETNYGETLYEIAQNTGSDVNDLIPQVKDKKGEPTIETNHNVASSDIYTVPPYYSGGGW